MEGLGKIAWKFIIPLMFDSDRTTWSGEEPSPRAVTVPLMATVLCAQEETLIFPLTFVMVSEGADPAGGFNCSG